MRTGRGPATLAERAAETRSRIIDATLATAQATGLRKVSMDEVAKRARVGRATLYKYFTNRDALVHAAVRIELDRFFAKVQRVTDEYPDPRDRVVHGFAYGYRELRSHGVVQAVLRLNPELLLPYIAHADSPALDLGREFVIAASGPDYLRADVLPQFAEHVARAFHTLILIPTNVFGLDGPDGPEDYARDYLLPVLDHLHARYPAGDASAG